MESVLGDLLSRCPGLRRILPDGSEGIAGFYSPDAGRIYTVTNTSNPEALSTLFHEYAHHFMIAGLTARAFPRWFTEGFAEFFVRHTKGLAIEREAVKALE